MTNREIAEQLGISPAALSLIINNKPGVSNATRERVREQLQEMGMEHLFNKSSAVTQSKSLCFLIYKRHGEILDQHPFFLLLMENIENQARAYGYNILLCTIDKRKQMQTQIQHINGLNAQGIIVFATEMQDEDMDIFMKLQIPVVALDNDFTRLSCNTIAINNYMGTYQAIEYLVHRGHTRIGYLKSNIRINSFKERHQGYENALAHFHLKFAAEHILILRYTEEGSYQDMKQYLESKKKPELPDAFVCDDDTIAAGVLRALIEYGYHVPKDISLIGFNDRPMCEVTNPPLTSVNVSKHALAVEAVDELIRLIKNQQMMISETRSRKIRIGTKLILRDSVLERQK